MNGLRSLDVMETSVEEGLLRYQRLDPCVPPIIGQFQAWRGRGPQWHEPVNQQSFEAVESVERSTVLALLGSDLHVVQEPQALPDVEPFKRRPQSPPFVVRCISRHVWNAKQCEDSHGGEEPRAGFHSP